jgi:predicted nucleic acid-binding Zn ribbon protein
MSKAKNPRQLAAVVADMCRTLGMSESYEQYRTLEIWKTVVGEGVAKVTTVEKIKDGNLYIKVRNPSWRMELNFRKADIRNKLNTAIGHELVSDIIFK